VRIGDGCATVTGYEFRLPFATSNEAAARATDCASSREGRNEVQARSQDTGWAVLVAAVSFGAANFSDKEKDEASLLTCFQENSWMPSFSVLPGSGGFSFSGPALVSQPKPRPARRDH
jgi:hypothetical protein